MSRLPELSSTEPSLIGAPSAKPRLMKGALAASAVPPAAASTRLRVSVTGSAPFELQGSSLFVRSRRSAAGLRRRRLRDGRVADRGREIETDALADALE